MKKFLSIIILIVILVYPQVALAATDGPRNPGTDVGAANGSCSNGVNWGDPGLATDALDGAYLTITGNNLDAGELTDELRISNFGFALTNVSSIDGITVEIIGFTTLGGADYTTVSLFTAPGSNQGDNKATGSLPTSDPGTTYQTFGGTADDWFPAGSWTEAEIESADFGVALCFTASGANTRINIDHVRITVTYTAAGAVPTVTTVAAGGVGVGSAMLNGTVTDDGGDPADTVGFAYGTDSTLATVIATTTETGTFATDATFDESVQTLQAGVTYYFRAYAINETGTGIASNILNFTTGTDTGIRRSIRLFEGFFIKLFSGRIILFQQ